MIFRTVSPIEKYRKRAQRNELELLSGRRERHTEFVNREILSAIPVKDGAVVLDVGCGNGALLHALSDRISEGVGTVPTEEERLLLLQQKHPDNVSYRTCLSAALPFAADTFDLAILNGVLLLLRDLDEAAVTISELARVVKPGGTIWIGEAVVVARPRRSGFATAIRNIKTLLRGKRIPMMRRPLVTPPAWVRKCATEQGLRIVLEKQHAVLDRDGLQLTSDQSRRDFMLEK